MPTHFDRPLTRKIYCALRAEYFAFGKGKQSFAAFLEDTVFDFVEDNEVFALRDPYKLPQSLPNPQTYVDFIEKGSFEFSRSNTKTSKRSLSTNRTLHLILLFLYARKPDVVQRWLDSESGKIPSNAIEGKIEATQLSAAHIYLPKIGVVVRKSRLEQFLLETSLEEGDYSKRRLPEVLCYFLNVTPARKQERFLFVAPETIFELGNSVVDGKPWAGAPVRWGENQNTREALEPHGIFTNLALETYADTIAIRHNRVVHSSLRSKPVFISDDCSIFFASMELKNGLKVYRSIRVLNEPDDEDEGKFKSTGTIELFDYTGRGENICIIDPNEYEQLILEYIAAMGEYS